MEITKSRRQVLMTTAMIGISGCSGNSSNNEEANTNRSGTTKETTESTDASSEEPTQYERKWTASRGIISIDVYDDIVYALSSYDEVLSLDIETGKQKWSKELLEENTEYYITTTDPYIITPFSVRNRRDGSVHWRGTDQFGDEFRPVSVVDDALYAITGPSSDERNLTKINLESGSMDWEAPLTFTVIGSNHGLYLLRLKNDNTRQLVAKNQSTGENIYTKEMPSDSNLIATSNNSLIGYRINDQGSFLFALDAESGDRLWETEINDGFPVFGSRGRKSHILSENIIYFSVWDRSNNKFTVQSYNLSNGKLRWKENVSLSIIEFSLGMAKNGNTVFFGKLGQGGTKLVLLNSNNGEIMSTNPVKTMPLTAVGNNLLGLINNSGENYQTLAMFEPENN